MTRKKKMRRVWNTNINPVMHAIMGAAITPAAELNKLRVQEMNAIDAFAQGRATLHDFQSCVALLNLCEHMATTGVGPEALEACGRAQKALIDAKGAFDKNQRFEMDSEGIKALYDLYGYHDMQRQVVARSVYERAICKTFERVKNKAPGVVEL